jgi:hypothetical protein
VDQVLAEDHWETVNALEDVVGLVCEEGGMLESHGVPAFADALRLLADYERVRIVFASAAFVSAVRLIDDE